MTTRGYPAQRRDSPKGLSATEADAINIQNQLNSPLLRMPAEIRNQIFEYAFGGLFVTVAKFKIARPLWYTSQPNSSNIASTTLEKLFKASACCRQIYAETTPLLFKNNEISVGGVEQMGLRTFVSALTPAQKTSISTLSWSIDLWSTTCFRKAGLLELKGLRRLTTKISLMDYEEGRTFEGVKKQIERVFEGFHGTKPELIFEAVML